MFDRLCRDPDPLHGLLRLVPDRGKQLAVITRSDGLAPGVEVAAWGVSGSEASLYAQFVAGNVGQTVRNFTNAAVSWRESMPLQSEGLLIVIDGIDRVGDRVGLDFLLASFSSRSIRFAFSA